MINANEIPIHATVYSLLAYANRVGGRDDLLNEKALNASSFRHFLNWGFDAQRHLEELGIQGLSGLGLVARHTWAPQLQNRHGIFQSLAMDVALAEGDIKLKPDLKRWTRMYSLGRYRLRSCPDCVADDVTSSGVAHWRLFHLWPFAHHCIRHQTRLQSRCGGCGVPFMHSGAGLLPSDPCAACGSRSLTSEALPWDSPPEAYWALMRGMWDELTTTSRIVPPTMRDIRKRASIMRGKGQSGDLVDSVLKDWGADSVAELSHMLGSTASVDACLQSVVRCHTLSMVVAQAVARVRQNDLPDRVHLLDEQGVNGAASAVGRKSAFQMALF